MEAGKSAKVRDMNTFEVNFNQKVPMVDLMDSLEHDLKSFEELGSKENKLNISQSIGYKDAQPNETTELAKASSLHSDDTIDKFWASTTSWNEREELAVKPILDYEEKYKSEVNMHLLAYFGHLERIKDLQEMYKKQEEEKKRIEEEKLKEKEESSQSLKKNSDVPIIIEEQKVQPFNERTSIEKTVLQVHDIDYINQEPENEKEFFVRKSDSQSNQPSSIIEEKNVKQQILKNPKQQNNNERISDSNKNTSSIVYESLSQKDDLELTPLIYAIWGEIKRNDNNKSVSNYILKAYLDENNSKAPEKHLKTVESLLKNELGHALVHGILYELRDSQIELNKIENKEPSNNEIKVNDLENEIPLKNEKEIENKELFEINQETPKINSWIEKFLTEDYAESVAYYIQKYGFSMSKRYFKHPKCVFNPNLSMVAYSLRVTSVKCTKLLFEHMVADISTPKFDEMMTTIESELFEYLTFNSEKTKEFLEHLVNVQQKSMWVNINRIPSCELVPGNFKTISSKSYRYFDKMSYAKDYMLCEIINSTIQLPREAGTKNSLELLQRLGTTENLKLFRNPLIQFYLHSKWDKVWILTILEAILMWSNIPLVILLVFVDNYNRVLLYIFSAVIFVLIIFKMFQLYSFYLLQYLEYVDRKAYYLGLRLLMMTFIFIPNNNLEFCVIYTFLSAFFYSDAGIKEIVSTICCFFGFLIVIFPSFWLEWENRAYLMQGIGSFLIVLFTGLGVLNCLKGYHERFLKTINFCLRSILLGLLITVIFMVKEDFGIMILTQFVMGIVFITQVFRLNQFIELLLAIPDFCIMVIFSINFYTYGNESYYSLNALTLIFEVVCISIQLVKHRKSLDEKDESKIYHTFFSTILIGFNSNDLVPIMIIVILMEIFYMLYYTQTKKISIIKLLKNSLLQLVSWSAIDTARLALNAYWIGEQFMSFTNNYRSYALIVLIMLRSLTSFRTFKMTRYYVRLIIYSLRDVLPFIVIFFYSTLSFGIIIAIYDYSTIQNIWIYSYDLNIGEDRHTSGLAMDYISFFIATITNIIIMLNLLISILSDSYDRFQLNAAEFDYLEMAQTLVEIESLIVWKRLREGSLAFLLAITSNDKVKVRKGKVTMDEFFELKLLIESLNTKMNNEIDTLEYDIITKADLIKKNYKNNGLEKNMFSIPEVGEKENEANTANKPKY